MTNYGIPPELQLKKLQGHNKSAIDLSNANPAHGHKDIPRSTSHIMVTTRYSDQQEFKSRKKLCDSTQAMGPTNIKMIHQNSLRHIESSLDRLGLSSPTHDQRVVSATKRTYYAPTSFNQQVQVYQGHISYKNKEN